jgi:outer membrane protein assembly factor BamB
MLKQPAQRAAKAQRARARWALRGAVTASLILSSVATGCELFEGALGLRSTDKNATDRIVWTVSGRTNNGIPWYDDSTAYFLGMYHDVTAVRKRDGSVVWETSLPVERDHTVGYNGFVAQGRVLIGDQDLFALDPTDGHVLWRFATTDGVDIGRHILGGENGLAYTCSSNAYIFAVDIVTGQERWRTRLLDGGTMVGTYLGGTLDGTLYVSFSDLGQSLRDQPLGGVAALDALTGSVKWLRMLPHDVEPDGPTATIDPVAIGSVVVAGARDGPLYAFDRLTGDLRWKAPALPALAPGSPVQRDVRHLAACAGMVFSGSDTGILVALDAETGDELWRLPQRLGSHAGVACDARFVYAFYAYGQLEAFDAQAGRLRWGINEPRTYNFFHGGITDAQLLFAGGTRGVYALWK